MAYTPTVWAKGDVITAVKLNKAEQGIASASAAELPSVTTADEGKVLKVDSSGDWVAANENEEKIFVVNVTYDETQQANVPNKTYAETLAAFNDGKVVYMTFEEDDSIWSSGICLLESGLNGLVFACVAIATTGAEGVSYGKFCSVLFKPDGSIVDFNEPTN